MFVFLQQAYSAIDLLSNEYLKIEKAETTAIRNYLRVLTKKISLSEIHTENWDEKRNVLKQHHNSLLPHMDFIEYLEKLDKNNTENPSLGIKEKIKYIVSYYTKLKNDMERYYKIFDIFNNVKNKNGALGNITLEDNNNLLEKETKSSLNKSLGRIFIIENDGSFSSGTGMLIQNGHDTYILTCKHNFKNPKGCSFYFVPNFLINPNTGYPKDIEFAFKKLEEKGNYNDFNDEKIEHFKNYIKNYFEKTSTYYSIIKVDITNIYRNETDVIPIGFKQFSSQNFIDTPVFCKIDMTNKKLEPIALYKKEITNINTKRYTIGYPILQNLDMDISALGRFVLGGAAPLVLTSSKKFIKISTNSYNTEAPSINGMSGGPIFEVENNTIKIIGVVGSGNMDINEILTF